MERSGQPYDPAPLRLEKLSPVYPWRRRASLKVLKSLFPAGNATTNIIRIRSFRDHLYRPQIRQIYIFLSRCASSERESDSKYRYTILVSCQALAGTLARPSDR